MPRTRSLQKHTGRSPGRQFARSRRNRKTKGRPRRHRRGTEVHIYIHIKNGSDPDDIEGETVVKFQMNVPHNISSVKKTLQEKYSNQYHILEVFAIQPDTPPTAGSCGEGQEVSALKIYLCNVCKKVDRTILERFWNKVQRMTQSLTPISKKKSELNNIIDKRCYFEFMFDDIFDYTECCKWISHFDELLEEDTYSIYSNVYGLTTLLNELN